MAKLKMLRRIRAVTAAAMCACILAGLFAGCGNQTGTETTGAASSTYTIFLENKAGTPLSKVTVRVYADDAGTDLVTAGKTDAEGRLSFSGVPDGNYTAVVSNLPDGYTADGSYPLEEETVIVPSIGSMTDEDMDNITYSLGDAVLDFSVTAVDGTAYSLSELLQKKKAVVLNFWYLQCSPCRLEFPYVQQAYEQYSDDIALLAMNPMDGDDRQIAMFQQDNGLTFPMFSCDSRWQSMMQVAMYPTTVVIDRYGNICLIHSGMVTEVEQLTRVFEYFTSDHYEQQFFKSAEEIPSV